MLAFISISPGSSSDKECFLRIIDDKCIDYGETPVPMIQLTRDINWTEGGANLTAIGEWDFSDRTCFYWLDSGNKRIYVKGRSH